jgi:hypothetical protein
MLLDSSVPVDPISMEVIIFVDELLAHPELALLKTPS